MIDAGVYLLLLVWSVRIIANLLSFVHLWYVKEYRFDRMMVHLKTDQGKKLLFIPWRRPPISPKCVAIFLGSSLILFLLYFTLPAAIFIKFAILDLSAFPVTGFMVMLLKAPTAVYHRYLIRKAQMLLQKHKPMKVVGITGSYGKTSTKEILTTLLSQKYKTIATRASKNSPIAIAELLLSQLRPDTEVFVVEMGAYKKGEIAQMCAMVHPEIGIVTAINAQHQDLFGSMRNTIEAKYELLRGLTGKRIAIVNRDDPRVTEMGKRATREGCRVIEYSAKGITVTQDDHGLRFNRVSIRLFGRHQVSNVLAAIAAAEQVGMTKTEIIRACRFVRPLPHTMNPMKGPGGSLFIDDTFNNNPDAARAAVDFLALQKGRKILVFQPMIELGAYAQKSHKEIGAYIAQFCDEVILTNANYFKSFMEGAKTGASHTKISVKSPGAAVSYLREIVGGQDTVLFKGKETGRVLHELLRA